MSHTISASEEVNVRGHGKVSPYKALDQTQKYRTESGDVLYYEDRVGWKARLPNNQEILGDWFAGLAKVILIGVAVYILWQLVQALA